MVFKFNFTELTKSHLPNCYISALWWIEPADTVPLFFRVPGLIEKTSGSSCDLEHLCALLVDQPIRKILLCFVSLWCGFCFYTFGWLWWKLWEDFFCIPEALSLQQRGAPLLSTLRYIALSNQTVSDAPQRWPPQKTKQKILSLCLFRVSRIGAWLVQVADRRLSAVVLREVECVQVERLITRHLRPFSTSPFTMQPATSGVLANQKWAGSSGATAATVPVMAAHLAGSARPAVCLF